MMVTFASLAVIISSCQRPVEEFQIDTDVQHKTLKLFKDSSFVEEIKEIEDSYQYSGEWTGDLTEGSTFRTIATRKVHQILTLTPVHEYRIVNGHAVEIVKEKEQ